MNVDLDKVIEGMRLAVQEKGEGYVYEKPYDPECDCETCLYFLDDVPSCLVGHGLAHAGVSAELLSSKWLSKENAFHVLRTLTEGKGDSNLIDRVQEVQRRQDSGDTWGEAIKHLDS